MMDDDGNTHYSIFMVEPNSSRYKAGMRYALSINGYVTFFTPDALVEFRDYVDRFVDKETRE